MLHIYSCINSNSGGWLLRLVFLSQQGRGKCFIEYIPAEKCVGVPFGEHRIAEIQGVRQTSHDG